MSKPDINSLVWKFLLFVGVIIFSCSVPFSAQDGVKKPNAKMAKQLVYEGSLDYFAGNYEEAKKKFERARHEDPNNLQSTFNLGNTHYHLKNWDAARGMYKEAAKNPGANVAKQAQIYHNEGNTYMEQKKYREAIESYKKSLRLEPNSYITKYNLAYAQKMLQNQSNQDQNNKQDNDKEQEEQPDQNQDKQQDASQDKQSQLSKEQAEALLDAMKQEEKKIQEKNNRQNAHISPNAIDW